jgi:hypothetical protein
MTCIRHRKPTRHTCDDHVRETSRSPGPAFRNDPWGVPLRANAVAADNGGVRRWQVVLVVVLAMLAAAIFVVVKFFEFVGSQN